MNLLEYIIFFYNAFKVIITELHLEAINILNKYGGFEN